MRLRVGSVSIVMCLALLVTLAVVAPAGSQEKPRSGGELIFIVAAEPPSFDAHREETFAMLHPTAPHYNTLMRVEPNDRTGTKFVGDLAASWTISQDHRTIGVTPNGQKKPFDDKRVRRALTLALDRHEGSKALSRIALIKEVAGIQVPGTPWRRPRPSWRSWPGTAATSRRRGPRRSACSRRPAPRTCR